jgi:hypothetical protein
MNIWTQERGRAGGWRALYNVSSAGMAKGSSLFWAVYAARIEK